jgi:hypothetical protein
MPARPKKFLGARSPGEQRFLTPEVDCIIGSIDELFRRRPAIAGADLSTKVWNEFHAPTI